MQNQNCNEKSKNCGAEMSGDPLDLHFSMFELKKAIARARQTTPGKDGVCYAMLEHMTENSFP